MHIPARTVTSQCWHTTTTLFIVLITPSWSKSSPPFHCWVQRQEVCVWSLGFPPRCAERATRADGRWEEALMALNGILMSRPYQWPVCAPVLLMARRQQQQGPPPCQHLGHLFVCLFVRFYYFFSASCVWGLCSSATVPRTTNTNCLSLANILQAAQYCVMKEGVWEEELGQRALWVSKSAIFCAVIVCVCVCALPSKISHYVAHTVGGACEEESGGGPDTLTDRQKDRQAGSTELGKPRAPNDHLLNPISVQPGDSWLHRALGRRGVTHQVAGCCFNKPVKELVTAASVFQPRPTVASGS